MFMPELNPILSYLSFARGQLAQFITVGGAALAGNGEGGYQGSGGVEHYLPQVAIIDGRSLGRRTSRPTWERGNSYVAPNAYDRATPLGVIESFDCKPSGGEKRNASGSGENAAPPCFEAPPLLLGKAEVSPPEARQSAVRGRPQGHAGHLPSYSIKGFQDPCRGTSRPCSIGSREMAANDDAYDERGTRRDGPSAR